MPPTVWTAPMRPLKLMSNPGLDGDTEGVLDGLDEESTLSFSAAFDLLITGAELAQPGGTQPRQA